MIVNGQLVDSVSGKTFENINPYDGSVVCTVPAGVKEDFEKAAAIAVKAQKEWAATPFYQRANIIKKFVSLVRADADTILTGDNGYHSIANAGDDPLVFLAVVIKY